MSRTGTRDRESPVTRRSPERVAISGSTRSTRTLPQKKAATRGHVAACIPMRFTFSLTRDGPTRAQFQRLVGTQDKHVSTVHATDGLRPGYYAPASMGGRTAAASRNLVDAENCSLTRTGTSISTSVLALPNGSRNDLETVTRPR